MLWRYEYRGRRSHGCWWLLSIAQGYRKHARAPRHHGTTHGDRPQTRQMSHLFTLPHFDVVEAQSHDVGRRFPVDTVRARGQEDPGPRCRIFDGRLSLVEKMRPRLDLQRKIRAVHKSCPYLHRPCWIPPSIRAFDQDLAEDGDIRDVSRV